VKTTCFVFVPFAIALAGCADIRPEHLDGAQREAVEAGKRERTPALGDEAVLRTVDKRDFFDTTTVVSKFGSVKDESGNSIWLLHGLAQTKSVVNVPAGGYRIFVTCSSGALYNNHLLEIQLAAKSDTTVFCLPENGKLFGLPATAGFHVFAADTNRFAEYQAKYRQLIAQKQRITECGERCQELSQ